MYFIALGQKWKLSLSMKWAFRSITTEISTIVGVLSKKEQITIFQVKNLPVIANRFHIFQPLSHLMASCNI